MKLKLECKKFLIFIICHCILLTSCIPDPSRTGLAPRGRACQWEEKCPKRCYWSNSIRSKACNTCPLPDLAKPLSPIELIDFALWNNPDTKKSWAEAREAAFNLGIQKSALYPSVELQETLAFTKQKGGSGNLSNVDNIINDNGDNETLGMDVQTPTVVTGSEEQYFNTLITDLMVSYLIFDFGGRCASIEAARQALYASNWMHNRTLQTVINRVIAAYYNQINANAIYLESLRTLEDAKMTLESATAMQEVGVKTIADVLQAKSNYASAQLQVVENWGKLMTSKGKLSRELGLSADIQLELKVMPEKLQMHEINLNMEQLMEVAKRNRPDLAAAHALFLENIEEVKAAWSSGMPTLTANVDIQDQKILNKKHLDGYIYTGAFTLNVPIFNGFYYVNQVRAAKAQAMAACADLQNREQSILLEVLEAYYEYQTAKDNIVYSTEFLESSSLNYEVALANYRAGTGTILDVLNALKDLAQARSQFIQSKTDLLKSLANMAYATGTIGNNNFRL